MLDVEDFILGLSEVEAMRAMALLGTDDWYAWAEDKDTTESEG